MPRTPGYVVRRPPVIFVVRLCRTTTPPCFLPRQVTRFRHWIHTPGGPRITPQQPPPRQDRGSQRSVPPQGRKGIGRTARVVPALRSEPRRHDQLITTHRGRRGPPQRVEPLTARHGCAPVAVDCATPCAARIAAV